MTLIGRKLAIQLHHPDIAAKMPMVEGQILKFVTLKRSKLFGCIVKLSRPFKKALISENEAKKIKGEIQYAILTKRENVFPKLKDKQALNLMVSFITGNAVLDRNPDLWGDNDVIGYSFGETTLKK